VGNLPGEASRSDLARLFTDFSYDYIRITPRGFGFVALKNSADVERAVRELDGRLRTHRNGRITGSISRY
jgi:RNA recognition motif-containing protein